MKFKDYCQYLDNFEKLSSRNEITVLLSELIGKLNKKEYEAAFYMMQGRLVPLYKDLEFNFSTNLLIKALQSNGYDSINDAYKVKGDLGLAVAEVVDNTGNTYSLVEVHTMMKDIASVEGKDSQQKKSKKTIEIIDNLSSIEAKFFVRIVIGKLRLGVSDKTILDALSWVVKGDKSLKPKLEESYGSKANLPEIAKVVMSEGEEGLSKITMEPGIPLASKLVEREKSFEKIMDRFPEGAIVQPKYDGLRMQIHYSKDGFDDESEAKVRLFSRNMSSLTEMFPEVVNWLEELNAKSFILDAEVIGFDPKTGKQLPFQETASRKRKYGVQEKVSEIPVKVFCFDILYFNGRELLKKDLEERLKLMSGLLKGNEKLVASESVKVETPGELKERFEEYSEMGLEGLIAKDPLSLYEPGTRNYVWIKLKVRAQKELADSIDAVILGYYFGRGQRAKFGIGAILVGIRDIRNDRFVSVAKVGTGFKDEDWKTLKNRLDELEVESVPDNVDLSKQLMPDVVCKPELVCVVEADEVSISKVHGGGEGYSLRFPRFIGLRKDKDGESATTMEELKKLYRFAKDME